MSKRLQVVLDPKEWKLFAQMAKREGVSLGEWVRQNLRKAANGTPVTDPKERIRRLKVIASLSNGPTGDIDQLLKEIERGRR